MVPLCRVQVFDLYTSGELSRQFVFPPECQPLSHVAYDLPVTSITEHKVSSDMNICIDIRRAAKGPLMEHSNSTIGLVFLES
jgi:hypothetical protein